MDSVSVNTDHFVPVLMLPWSDEISSLSANIQHQSNKPLADDSVSAGPVHWGIEGKFGEISGTNDVQSVTTGQHPHNLYRGY